jgi:aconitate hydratase
MSAVVAKSFARIHRRNLIAQGVVPLTYINEADHERTVQGERWSMPSLRQELESDSPTVTVVGKGRTFLVAAGLSEREREVLIAGGLLAQFRRGGAQLSAGQAVSGAVDQGSPITQPAPGQDAPAEDFPYGSGLTPTGGVDADRDMA